VRPALAETRSFLIILVCTLLAVGAASFATASDGSPDAAAATTVGPAGSDSGPYLLEVGRPFPPLVLPAAADGRPLSLADFRGRKTILHVFASW